MKIIVYQGDENRAKIETKYTKDSYFAGVYKRAMELTEEITYELRQVFQSENKMDCAFSAFQRIPNNIIAFCAQRGQGKTTAMKSFANILARGYVEEGRSNNILEDNLFIVLDSIDPSALDGGESIVRVVLSRLFYRLEEKWSKGCEIKEKLKTLELFEKCYSAIDYINGAGRETHKRDNLDELATLGSSSRLKKNLKDLITLFLMTYVSEDEVNRKTPFLVIPIDDVDICTADIYRCCEEIRNYLSLPNVLILLAADYTQLSHVIYQKYLRNNKKLLKYEEENAKEECSRLAAGYLLKLLPVNHIIELPELDKIAEHEWVSLRLEYYINKNNYKQNILEESNSQQIDLQQQIEKIIYDKTGVILYDEKELLAECLPKTMRELTQFLKRIGQRPDIDWNILYGNEREQAKDEVDKLKNNIRLLKSYFVEAWCMNHMSHEDYTNFQKSINKLEGQKRAGRLSWTYRELLNYLNTGERKNSERDNFKGMQVQNSILAMYITIFLNEWFAEALQDSLEKQIVSKQYKKIADFVNISADTFPEIPSEDAEPGKYMVYSFEVSLNSFPDEEWLKEKKGSFYFFRNQGEKFGFDILNPIDHILREGDSYFIFYSKSAEDRQKNASISEKNASVNEVRKTAWIQIKNIVANVGICREAIKQLQKISQSTAQEIRKGERWQDKIIGFYKKILNRDGQLKYLGIFNDVTPDLKETLTNELKAYDFLFLFNSYNLNTYYTAYKKCYDWILTGSDLTPKTADLDIKLESALNPGLPVNPKDIQGITNNITERIWESDYRLKEIILSTRAIQKMLPQLVDNIKNEVENPEEQLYITAKILNSVRHEYRKNVNEMDEQKKGTSKSGETKASKEKINK